MSLSCPSMADMRTHMHSDLYMHLSDITRSITSLHEIVR